MTDSDAGLFQDGGHVIPDQDPRAFDAPDLGPEDIADHIARSVAAVLEATGLIEIKEVKSSVGQCHFFGRVRDQDKTKWAKLKKLMLITMRFECDGFVGTQDIVKLKPGAPEDSRNPEDYDHKFGHLLSIGARDLKHAAEELCKVVIDNNPTPRVEVMEAPMLGHGAPLSGGREDWQEGRPPNHGGHQMSVQVEMGENLPGKFKKQIEAKSIEDANEVRARYKIEIIFGPDRSQTDLKPSVGALLIWESGKMFHGGGDVKMYWCGFEDCQWPFSDENLAIAHVVCPKCNREQFRDHMTREDHIRHLKEERRDSKGLERMPCMVGEKLFRLPPPKAAQLLVKTFRQLGSNADIYLKYHPKDIRIDKKDPSSAESMNKLVMARLRKQPLLYPLKNILKDTSAGADLYKRFLAMLKA